MHLCALLHAASAKAERRARLEVHIHPVAIHNFDTIDLHVTVVRQGVGSGMGDGGTSFCSSSWYLNSCQFISLRLSVTPPIRDIKPRVPTPSHITLAGVTPLGSMLLPPSSLPPPPPLPPLSFLGFAFDAFSAVFLADPDLGKKFSKPAAKAGKSWAWA